MPVLYADCYPKDRNKLPSCLSSYYFGSWQSYQTCILTNTTPVGVQPLLGAEIPQLYLLRSSLVSFIYERLSWWSMNVWLIWLWLSGPGVGIPSKQGQILSPINLQMRFTIAIQPPMITWTKIHREKKKWKASHFWRGRAAWIDTGFMVSDSRPL